MGGSSCFSCSLWLDAMLSSVMPVPWSITMTAPCALGELAEARPAPRQLSGQRFTLYFTHGQMKIAVAMNIILQCGSPENFSFARFKPLPESSLFSTLKIAS